jgi:hypothetical protein
LGEVSSEITGGLFLYSLLLIDKIAKRNSIMKFRFEMGRSKNGKKMGLSF